MIDTEQPPKSYMSRAARILICLSKGISMLTDIANACHLSKSTVHRILRALVEEDFVVLDPVYHRYYLGGLINYLSINPQTAHQYLISYSLDEMTRLWNITEETVNLGILNGSLHLTLHEIPSRHDLKITMEIMRPRPVFAGATIRTLFSQLNDEALEVILKSINIEPTTEQTITDKKLLMTQIKQAQQRGYAVSHGERTVGAAAISAPISNYTCPATLSIFGFEGRMKPKESYFVKELVESASRISENLKRTSKSFA